MCRRRLLVGALLLAACGDASLPTSAGNTPPVPLVPAAPVIPHVITGDIAGDAGKRLRGAGVIYSSSFDLFEGSPVAVDSTGHFAFSLSASWRYVEVYGIKREPGWSVQFVALRLDTLSDTVWVNLTLQPR